MLSRAMLHIDTLLASLVCDLGEYAMKRRK
jgi:hypothetical protein